MTDQSHLDKKYFIDEYRYNCPYCNRGSVSYDVATKSAYDWSNERTVFIYKVKCGSCGKQSMHFSNFDFERRYNAATPFFKYGPTNTEDDEENYDSSNLDDYFFYHQPSSYFTLDSNIPEKIRELVAEAEGCKKMNFLIGASGALRKAIYEFLQDQKAAGENYEDRIKALKKLYPQVDAQYFDALANIQDMTSENLHEKEGTWEAWDRDDLNFLIQVTKVVLEEVYVKPKKRSDDLQRVLELKRSSSFSGSVPADSDVKKVETV